MKTQLAKLGVEVTIEVLDRPIFLKRLTTTKDYDQVVNFSSHIVDPFNRSFVVDSRGAANAPNHKDQAVECCWTVWPCPPRLRSSAAWGVSCRSTSTNT